MMKMIPSAMVVTIMPSKGLIPSWENPQGILAGRECGGLNQEPNGLTQAKKVLKPLCCFFDNIVNDPE